MLQEKTNADINKLLNSMVQRLLSSKFKPTQPIQRRVMHAKAASTLIVQPGTNPHSSKRPNLNERPTFLQQNRVPSNNCGPGVTGCQTSV
jgi:hypothetical protein